MSKVILCFSSLAPLPEWGRLFFDRLSTHMPAFRPGYGTQAAMPALSYAIQGRRRTPCGLRDYNSTGALFSGPPNMTKLLGVDDGEGGVCVCGG